MVWTYLRACYQFNMRLVVGGVESIYPARWYFCDPNARIFPSPHGAEASPWLKSFERNEEWGEVAPFKGLDRGINPGYPGQCFVGDLQWFIDGQLPASILTTIAPQPPACCGHTPPFNADPRCPPFRSLIPCPGCTGDFAYSGYRVVFAGAEGIYAYLNGVHWFEFESATSLFFFYGEAGMGDDNGLVIWFANFGMTLSVIGQATGQGAQWQVPPPLDCVDLPKTLPLVFNTSPDFPGVVTLA